MRMEADGLEVPEWVKDMAQRGDNFYCCVDGNLMQATPFGKYSKVLD